MEALLMGFLSTPGSTRILCLLSWMTKFVILAFQQHFHLNFGNASTHANRVIWIWKPSIYTSFWPLGQSECITCHWQQQHLVILLSHHLFTLIPGMCPHIWAGYITCIWKPYVYVLAWPLVGPKWVSHHQDDDTLWYYPPTLLHVVHR